MKPHNKSIELFGVSGSGKSYVRLRIKKKLSSEGYRLLDAREIIINYIDKFVDLNLYQKIKIFYFKFLLIFNIKTTLWNDDLNIICKKFLRNNQKKLNKYKIIKKTIFNKKELLKNKNYNFWIDELIVADLIFKKIANYSKKLIFFPDEGFVQRILILAYLESKFNSIKIKRYLNCNLNCNIVINVISSKNKIDSVILNRKSKNEGWIPTKQQILNMKKIEKTINKYHKLINILYIKNNNKIDIQILNILKKNKLISNETVETFNNTKLG